MHVFSVTESKWLSFYDQNKLCLGLKDGNHIIADVFGFLNCKGDNGFYKTCEQGKLFDPVSMQCHEGSLFSELLFCKNRPNGNYRDPWNCNKFILCVNENSVEQLCPHKLCYDPYKDICRDIPCKKLEGIFFLVSFFFFFLFLVIPIY